MEDVGQKLDKAKENSVSERIYILLEFDSVTFNNKVNTLLFGMLSIV